MPQAAAQQHEVELSRRVLAAFDALTGPHPGFRPTHAKGILVGGTFKPSPSGKSLTRAEHLWREETPVWVRFSDFGGIPDIPDNHAEASPRGMAIRFNLAEHVHTDIVCHSVNGFPARTAEEFVEFLEAISQSGSTTSKPTPVEAFLGSHPAALRFVKAPKPLPVSFAKESFFAVNAYQFTNREGITNFGRYRVMPDEGTEYFDGSQASSTSPDFLRNEITQRMSKGPVRFSIVVQVAEPGDTTDDSTVSWPEERSLVEFGTLALDSVVPDNAAEQQHIIFDPIPRLDGIAPSGDPLLEPRADVYLMSGRRRRGAQGI